MNTSLSINLQPAASADSGPERWVNLEAVEQPEVTQYGNLYDIDQMRARARSGLSAWSYIKAGCPLTIDDGAGNIMVDVALDFFSFPSAPDLVYQVSASIGTVGERIRLEQARELDVVFTGSRYQLPWYATGVSAEWVTPVFRSDGSIIPEPVPIRVDAGNALVVDAEGVAFGCARLKCLAHGFLHTTVIRLVKQAATKDEDGNLNTTGYRIENLACTANSSWDGGAETLALPIPKCVEDYLATCPDGELKSSITIDPGGEPRPYVYYNDCTGSVLLVIYR